LIKARVRAFFLVKKMDNNSSREQFASRLGFLLITAGCAIGLGNVWRFPYIAGQYGGAVFVIIYIAFLILLGFPLLTIELAVGRASRRSVGLSFETLTPNTKWYYGKYLMIAGNYILMSFYTMVTGWMLYYTIKMLKGDFTLAPMSQADSGGIFGTMLGDPLTQIACTLVVTVGAFSVCAFGLQEGVEKITKPLMVLLFLLIIFLSVRSFFLPGFAEGMRFYLMPDFSKITFNNLFEVLYAALGQAFFTLGLGVGSIQIFGSYMSSQKSITYEASVITLLDSIVAILAGIVIFPACFSYAVEPGQGPGLIFVTLVSVFSNMVGGQLWGSLFFMFMLFAAISTLIAVFENIVGISTDILKISRKKAVVFNCVAILLLGLPVILGFNVLSFITPLGEGTVILDLYDFILSQNILQIGAIIYVFYVTWKYGWGFDKYLAEANLGSGFKMTRKFQFYFKYVLPLIIVLLLIQGYIGIFGK